MEIRWNWTWVADLPRRIVSFLTRQPSPKIPHPLITIVFDSFYANSGHIQFRHFLEPGSKARPIAVPSPPNPLVVTLSRFIFFRFFFTLQDVFVESVIAVKYFFMNFLIKLVEVDFQRISFDFSLPLHSCAIQGYADKLNVMFLSSTELGNEGFNLLVIIEGGALEIFDDGLLAVHYVGHAARVSLHYHHPTRMQDIYINLYGQEDDLALKLKGFLSFYHKYQRAEDAAYEVKLARGLPTTGKMSFSVDFEHMKVSVEDDRCPKLIVILLDRIHAELCNFPLTLNQERTHKGRKCDTSSMSKDRLIPFLLEKVTNLGPNLTKCMKMTCLKASFHTKKRTTSPSLHTMFADIEESEIERYVVREASMIKTLQVHNEGDFMDDDLLQLSASYVNFEHMETELLQWMVTLQDTADRLPIPRFNHRKRVRMTFAMNDILFSVQPVAHSLDILSFIPTSMGLRMPSCPLDDNRWVVFSMKNLSAERKGQSGVLLSWYGLQMDKLEISTYQPLADFLKQHDLHGASPSNSQAQGGEGGEGMRVGGEKAVDYRREVFHTIISSYDSPSTPSFNSSKSSRIEKLYLASIWQIEAFDIAFWLSAKLDFEFFKCKTFTIDMDTTFLPKATSSSATTPSKSRYSFMKISSHIPHVMGMEITWIRGNMSVQIEQMHLNASTFSGLHFLSVFQMIRQSINRINFNISSAKARSPDLSKAQIPLGNVHYYVKSSATAGNSSNVQNSSTNSAPTPPGESVSDANPVTRVLVRQMTMGFAVEYDSNANGIDPFSDSSHAVNVDEEEKRKKNHCLLCSFHSLVYESSQTRKGLELLACEMHLSKYSQAPFMALTSLAMMKKQEAGQSVAQMDCRLGEWIVHLHPLMETGVLVDGLLMQFQAYKVATKKHIDRLRLAMERRINDLSLLSSSLSIMEPSSPLTNPVEPAISPSPSNTPSAASSDNGFYIAVVEIGNWEIHFDGPWNQILKPDLVVISYKKFKFSLTQTKTIEEIEAQITLLDLGSTDKLSTDNALHYVNITGGLVDCQIGEMEVNLTMQKESLISLGQWKWSGWMYQASVEDDRIPLEAKLIDVNHPILLSNCSSLDDSNPTQRNPFQGRKSMRRDGRTSTVTFANPSSTVTSPSTPPPPGATTPKPPSTSDQNQGSNDEKEGIWSVLPVSAVPIFALYTNQNGPGKFYLDLELSTESFHLNVFPDSFTGLAVVNNLIELCQPPNRDPSPLLPFWDSYRYWVHGPVTFHCQKIRMQYHTMHYLSQEMVLSLEMIDGRLFIQQDSIEMTAEDINVSADMTMVLLPQRKRTQQRFQRPRPRKMFTRFLNLPACVLAIQSSYIIDFQQTVKQLHNKTVYDHHDIYLLPALDLEALEEDVYSYRVDSEVFSPHDDQDSVDSDCSDQQLPYRPQSRVVWQQEEGSEKRQNPQGYLIDRDLRYIEKDAVVYYYHQNYFSKLRYLQDDRFHYFRSRPSTLKFNVELRLADRGSDRPVLIFLRLEDVMKILDALRQPAGVPSPTPAPAASSSGSVSYRLSSLSKPLVLVANGLARSPPPVVSPASLLAVAELQVVVNRALLTSWPSRSCLFGIILTHQLSEIEARFVRPTTDLSWTSITSSDSGPPPPLQIDHLVVDYYFAEIFARDLNISQREVEADLTHSSSSAPPVMLGEQGKQYGAVINPFHSHAQMLARRTGSSSHVNLTSPSTSTTTSSFANAPQSPSSERDNLPSSPSENDGEVVEPSRLVHLTALMKALHRLAYASKVVVSLTESGEVASQLNTFQTTGILAINGEDEREKTSGGAVGASEKNSRRSTFLVGKEWRRMSAGGKAEEAVDLKRLSSLRQSHIALRQSMAIQTSGLNSRSNSTRYRMNSIGSGGAGTGGGGRRRSVFSFSHNLPPVSPPSNVYDPSLHGFRASLLNFGYNHAAFSPPVYALPASYKTASTFLPSTNKILSVNSTVAANLEGGRSGSKAEGSSFGSKIWGLQVKDTKFLFTIAIRDTLFFYVSRTMAFVHTDSGDDSRDQSPTPTEINEGKESRKMASLDEFEIDDGEDGEHVTHLRSMQSSYLLKQQGEGSQAKAKAKATLQDFLIIADDPLEHSPDPHGENSSHSSSLTQNRIILNRQDNSIQIGAQHNKSRRKATFSGEEMPDVKNIAKHILAAPDTPTSPVVAPPIASLASSFREDESGVTIATEPMPPKRPKVLRRSSLYNKGIEMRDERTTDNLPSISAVPSSPRADNMKIPAAAPSPTSKSSKNKGSRAPTNQYFFNVELIHPQVNFLDTDSHSSLIIVAGRSSVEGKRLSTATLPPVRSSPSPYPGDEEDGTGGEQNEAKRRQEIRLKMDNVCAYTVPSLALPDDTDFSSATYGDGDQVYWKSTDSHVDSYLLRPLQRQISGPTVSASANSAPSLSAKLPSLTRKVYRITNTDNLEQPSNMLMAIKDFQIRACYIFWTDVTVQEAKELKIVRSKEDLVCTFRLELPNLAVDINSRQFHIMTSVVKNVLLLPPPTIPSQLTPLREEKANFIEIALPQLARALDWKMRSHREEIRGAIDDCLVDPAYDLTNSQIVRYAEVFIGRLTWVLRSSGNSVMVPVTGMMSHKNFSFPSSNAAASNATFTGSNIDKEREYDLVEAGLIGIYATLTFTKSRCINSLLEIQRFWAKNVDLNGGASTTTNAATAVGAANINASSVAVSMKGNASNTSGALDRSIVLQPVLEEADLCTRCGQAFNIEENHSAACTFHADDDGNPGVYRSMTIVDQLSQKETVIKAWSCCLRHHPDAIGCSVRPHVCKEVMFSIRAEVCPTMRLADQVEVTVFRTLDIAIFPGAHYDLKLQITRSLSEFLHKYFSVDEEEPLPPLSGLGGGSSDFIPGENAPVSASTPPRRKRRGLSVDSGGGGGLEADLEQNLMSNINKKTNNLIRYFQKKTVGLRKDGDRQVSGDSADADPSGRSFWSFARRRGSISSTDSNGSLGMGNGGSPGANSSGSGGGIGGSGGGMSGRVSSAGSGNNNDNPSNSSLSVSKKQNKQTGLYIKYMRVGDINVDVSTEGFTINLNNFQAVMEPFVRRGQLVTWAELIW
eukprot:scaffold3051_cov167-Ochromonas_danica.AAC.13